MSGHLCCRKAAIIVAALIQGAPVALPEPSMAQVVKAYPAGWFILESIVPDHRPPNNPSSLDAGRDGFVRVNSKTRTIFKGFHWKITFPAAGPMGRVRLRSRLYETAGGCLSRDGKQTPGYVGYAPVIKKCTSPSTLWQAYGQGGNRYVFCSPDTGGINWPFVYRACLERNDPFTAEYARMGVYPSGSFPPKMIWLVRQPVD
ncbi:hypothetical protein [Nonomuraea endophytica]|uniref:Uncharacterized protein n=1 Tax=Nonomuraea endophytica TaxID=714136 RepID=A0A7W8ELG3_9ACTN|nr:hypothetical protein [Nonomuraea endophytica]MBB5085270.1 hypothetical protein [Nonomuraea endophytica]